MKRIESFEVNHDLLQPGIYVSRIDRAGDESITTFDIRCKRPNAGDFMPLEAMHTIEHIGATYFRNSSLRSRVIYFGAMACSTGFYLVMVGDYPAGGQERSRIEDMIKDMWRYLSAYEGDVPGATRVECGNYLAHDLKGAKTIAYEFLALDADGKLEYEYRQ